MPNSKDGLVQDLIDDGFLKTPLIVSAFRAVNRRDFVPDNLKSEAYVNQPLPIGFGQTISQPLTVAFMLELLQPRPGEKILDIGSGSGWQTALLAYCVGNVEVENGVLGIEIKRKNQGKSGKVIAIERLPELKTMTEENVGRYGFIKEGISLVVLGDGSRGYKQEAPFDKIIAAASGDEIPKEWKEQVRVGGRIVAPVGNSIFSLTKTSRDAFDTSEHVGFNFVPLIRG